MPRKQWHTAWWIYRRILTEFPDAGIPESTARNHVWDCKHAMSLIQRETFVPQSYAQATRHRWIGLRREPISVASEPPL